MNQQGVGPDTIAGSRPGRSSMIRTGIQVSKEHSVPLRRPLFLRKPVPSQAAAAAASNAPPRMQHDALGGSQQPADSIDDSVEASGGPNSNTPRNNAGNLSLAAFKARLCKEAADAETRMHALGYDPTCGHSLSRHDEIACGASLAAKTQLEGGGMLDAAGSDGARKPPIKRAAAQQRHPGGRMPGGGIPSNVHSCVCLCCSAHLIVSHLKGVC